MQFKRITISLIIVSALLLSACTAVPGASGTVVQDKSKSETMMMEENSKDAMVEESHGEDNMAMEVEGGDSMSGGGGMMEETGSMSSDSHEGEMMDKSQEDTMPGEAEGSQGMQDESMSGEGAMMEAPAWLSAELVNARSGENFRIADYKGKVVLVETLAVWCSNCLRQQKQVKALHDLLGERDDFISLGLDIDPNEESELLKTYTEQNEFDWVYAISPAEISRELGQLYGAQYLNPPSTPMLIIDRHGEVHTLPFGIKSAEDLAEALQPFLDESM